MVKGKKVGTPRVVKVARNVASKVPDTGNHVTNGIIRGALCAGIVVLLCAIVGMCTRCSAVSSAQRVNGQQQMQQVQQDGDTHLQPGDDVPNGQSKLSPIDRNQVLTGTVSYIVDGDTMGIADPSGNVATVRLIGIDAPDCAHPDSKRNTREGALAADHLESLAPQGTKVWLTRDMSDKDHYGRILAYVWLKDPGEKETKAAESMLNALMVKDGFAQPQPISPDTNYEKLFDELAGKTSEESSSSSSSSSVSASSASSASASSASSASVSATSASSASSAA